MLIQRKARCSEFGKCRHCWLIKRFIQSINAINNDDWDAQKNIYKEVVNGPSKSQCMVNTFSMQNKSLIEEEKQFTSSRYLKQEKLIETGKIN